MEDSCRFSEREVVIIQRNEFHNTALISILDVGIRKPADVISTSANQNTGNNVDGSLLLLSVESRSSELITGRQHFRFEIHIFLLTRKEVG